MLEIDNNHIDIIKKYTLEVIENNYWINFEQSHLSKVYFYCKSCNSKISFFQNLSNKKLICNKCSKKVSICVCLKCDKFFNFNKKPKGDIDNYEFDVYHAILIYKEINNLIKKKIQLNKEFISNQNRIS